MLDEIVPDNTLLGKLTTNYHYLDLLYYYY